MLVFSLNYDLFCADCYCNLQTARHYFTQHLSLQLSKSYGNMHCTCFSCPHHPRLQWLEVRFRLRCETHSLLFISRIRWIVIALWYLLVGTAGERSRFSERVSTQGCGVNLGSTILKKPKAMVAEKLAPKSSLLRLYLIKGKRLVQPSVILSTFH